MCISSIYITSPFLETWSIYILKLHDHDGENGEKKYADFELTYSNHQYGMDDHTFPFCSEERLYWKYKSHCTHKLKKLGPQLLTFKYFSTMEECYIQYLEKML